MDDIESSTGIIKKIFNFFGEVFTINRRLKILENMHFNDIPHPGEICPKCGKHTVRQDTEAVHETEWLGEYEHTQNTFLFCTSKKCNFKKVIDTRIVKTNASVTNTTRKKGMNIKPIHVDSLQNRQI